MNLKFYIISTIICIVLYILWIIFIKGIYWHWEDELSFDENKNKYKEETPSRFIIILAFIGTFIPIFNLAITVMIWAHQLFDFHTNSLILKYRSRRVNKVIDWLKKEI